MLRAEEEKARRDGRVLSQQDSTVVRVTPYDVLYTLLPFVQDVQRRLQERRRKAQEAEADLRRLAAMEDKRVAAEERAEHDRA